MVKFKQEWVARYFKNGWQRISRISTIGLNGSMGAGSCLFVANTSNMPNAQISYTSMVTLNNVSFTNSHSMGGPSYCATGGVGGKGGSLYVGPTGGGLGQSSNFAPGSNWFGDSVIAGTFGALGTPASGGHGGHESNGGNGAKGGDSGYGSGGSGGGGGGGGGGFTYYSGRYGGNGGGGGFGGLEGFGGGKSGDPSSGAYGTAPHSIYGGSGGNGGIGAAMGTGAGFGGAIFLMDNANVTISGEGIMKGNMVQEGKSRRGNKGSAAGDDIFLQGSGTLIFSLQESEIYSIEDGIYDETGAVRVGKASVVSPRNGNDGMPAGGGTGIWNIKKIGKGTLVMPNHNLLSGFIDISEGSVDFSSSELGGNYDLYAEKGSIIHIPCEKASPLIMNILKTSKLELNGHSSIFCQQLECPADTLNLVLHPSGFISGQNFTLFTSCTPLASKLQVNSNDGFKIQVNEYTIKAIWEGK